MMVLLLTLFAMLSGGASNHVSPVQSMNTMTSGIHAQSHPRPTPSTAHPLAG
jgi:hypothetical protein